ncbi:MAG: hypothetical protein PHO41_03730 [Eubacteriales bacterium]|nr:hypothetical protein [Eubacteriales bacterium]
MNFSDKLSALLRLTGIKSADLADALEVGRPYISRLKTGARKMPSNVQVIHGMAEYFAARCEDDYRLNALRELTADPRLNTYIGTAALKDVLFDWLTDTKPEKSPAGRFLSSFELFRADDFAVDVATKGQPPLPNGISSYYNNDGKRQALRDLLVYVDSLNTPCTVLLFTDETYDWLVEDAEFARWLNAGLSEQAARGVTFQRIQPPFCSLDFAFSAIERWLPAFMAGGMQQFYYPWPRDELHRRTLFVVPGHIALYSNSVCGEYEAPITFLTREPGIVSTCVKDYEAILKHCRPSMSTFSADSARLFDEMEAIVAMEDVGVYKIDSLSVNTLPPEIIGRIRQRGTPFTRRMCDSLERRGQARATVLLHHSITDIMYLPKLENVLAGTEPIPGTQIIKDGALYYTPKEYRAHLDRILWHLDVFPNYKAIFTDDPLNDNVIVYVKGDSRALLIKQSAPFAAFDITEHGMAVAFCDYLRRIAAEKLAVSTRRSTIERLKEELKKLSEAMA